jgi:photosystem II stability/assembly factor-like uncharacterized protein
MQKIGLILTIFTIVSIVSATQILAQSISWQQLNGPFGGTALSFVSNANGDIFAGTDQDQRGIFRSTDGGLTWQPKSAGLYLDNRAFSWLVVDDSSYIIAGTNSHIGSKVYKSKDNGESWTQISILGGTSVAVNDSGHIYVGNTAYGQYSVSKDGGYTWIHYPSPASFTYCITINDSGHIFIGGNYTGYRSKDNGANWTTLSLPDGINSIAVAPNGNLFAGCSRENASNSGVYRSTDNGDSWTAVKEGFRVYASNNIVVNNNGDIIVGTWGWGIWKSTDNGDTWTQYNSGLGHFYIKSMLVTNNGDVYAGLSGGGIYRSTDNGENWQQVGITVSSVKKIAINPVNSHMFAAVNGISRSTDSGETWQPMNNGLSGMDVRSFVIKDDGTIFAGCAISNWAYPNPCIFHSTDNGNSWSVIENGLQRHDVGAMTVDAEGNVYAGNYYGVYKSTNNGSNWFNIGGAGGAKGLSFNSHGDLFLASYGGGFWKLPEGDTTWVDLTSNIGSNYTYTLFVGSNDFIYTHQKRSTDNGQTWTTYSVGDFVYSVAENSAGHIFIGTNSYGQGIYRSVDYGDTWELIRNGLPSPVIDINSLAVDSDDYLYAGTNGMSMFKTTTSTVTSVEEIKLNPVSFYLEQNYPNPFNPNTKIHFTIPRESHVTLKIYDILGKEMETLVNEIVQPGNYERLYDGSRLTSGVYFYRLVTDSYTSTKKLILLK